MPVSVSACALGVPEASSGFAGSRNPGSGPQLASGPRSQKADSMAMTNTTAASSADRGLDAPVILPSFLSNAHTSLPVHRHGP